MHASENARTDDESLPPLLEHWTQFPGGPGGPGGPWGPELWRGEGKIHLCGEGFGWVDRDTSLELRKYIRGIYRKTNQVEP